MGGRRIIGIDKSIDTVLCDGHLQGKKVAPFERAEKKPKKGMPPPDATSEPKSVVPYVG